MLTKRICLAPQSRNPAELRREWRGGCPLRGSHSLENYSDDFEGAKQIPTTQKMIQKNMLLYLLILLISSVLVFADSMTVTVRPDSDFIKQGQEFNFTVILGPTGSRLYSATLRLTESSNTFDFESRGTLAERQANGNIFTPLTINQFINEFWIMFGLSGTAVTLTDTSGDHYLLGKIPATALTTGTVSDSSILLSSYELVQVLNALGSDTTYDVPAGNFQVTPFTIYPVSAECGSNADCTGNANVCDQTAFRCVQGMAVSSEGIVNGYIDSAYSAAGRGVNPPLSITGIPLGTQSLAIIMDDLTDGNGASTTDEYVHWVLWNVLPNPAPNSAQLTIPESITQGNVGINSNPTLPNTGYTGPAPPVGQTHQYRFRVYALNQIRVDALDQLLDLAINPTKDELLAAMQISDDTLSGWPQGLVVTMASVTANYRVECDTVPSACLDQTACVGANYFWDGTICSAMCPMGTSDPDNDHVCTVTPSTEICTNDIDDNNNGDVDCADADCTGNAACQTSQDGDGDGVVNTDDQCLNTPVGKEVYPTGSPNAGCQLGDINKNGCIDLPDWNIFLGLVGTQFEDTSYRGPADLNNAGGLGLPDWNLFLNTMADFTTC